MINSIANDRLAADVDNKTVLSESTGWVSHISGPLHNLPIEMTHKIVSYLSSIDVSNLRATSYILSNYIESFEVMSYKLNNKNLRGELKYNYLQILCDKRVREWLQKDNKNDIRQALKNLSASQPLGKNKTRVETKYLPDNYGDDNCRRVDRIFNTLQFTMKFRDFSTSCDSFSPSFYPNKLWKNSIKFQNEHVNLLVIEDILSSAQTVFFETKGAEKLVLASLVFLLINEWTNNTPNHIDKKHIRRLSSPYAELLITGNKAINIALEI